MSELVEVRVPDIGDFDEVDVVEVLVKAGDEVEADDSLITLESDKASMDIPAPAGGVVKEVKTAVGEKVSEGTLIAVIEVAREDAAEEPGREKEEEEPRREERTERERRERPVAEAPAVAHGGEFDAEVLVLGSGPGGYTAAFRAADLGKRTVLVERYATLGGVCLNVGCIPSKALLHAARVIEEAGAFAEHGIRFGEPRIELEALRRWKDSVVKRLTGGLDQMARRREVEVIQGTGRFVSPHELEIESADGTRRVSFENAIVAAGSRAAELPGFPRDESRIMDSTGALELEEIPSRLLVVGGGIIGLEMATVYAALGSRVTVVELLEGLIPGCDRDLVRPLHKRIESRYEAIYLSTRVTGIESSKDGLRVSFEGEKAPARDTFDRVLVAVGRRPNGQSIGAEQAGIHVDEKGFIPVDEEQRTNVSHIFAIGDIVGEPMLAHKASYEGKVAAEVISGLASAFDARVIPSVAYTDPEVAWVGLTETDAKQKGIPYEKGSFPWSASGRSLGMGRQEGMTKLLFDPETERLVGAGMVGPHAGDLVSEAALAIEMGSDAADVALTIHPHPTLSETVSFAAEAFEGTLTDLYLPRKRRQKG